MKFYVVVREGSVGVDREDLPDDDRLGVRISLFRDRRRVLPVLVEPEEVWALVVDVNEFHPDARVRTQVRFLGCRVLENTNSRFQSNYASLGFK